jgi:hypothetical protein
LIETAAGWERRWGASGEYQLVLRADGSARILNHDRQRFLALLAAQVHLRGQSAARATQPMVGGLVPDPTGRLGLKIPVTFACAGRVLVCPGNGGIHRHVPGDAPRHVG